MSKMTYDPYPREETCPACGKTLKITRFGSLENPNVKCPCGNATYVRDHGWVYYKPHPESPCLNCDNYRTLIVGGSKWCTLEVLDRCPQILTEAWPCSRQKEVNK